MDIRKSAGLMVLSLLAACASAPDKPDAANATKTSTAANEATAVSDDPNADIRDKYEQIEYGQALPLVCTSPVAADGRFTRRPNLQLMWENYLYDRPEGIWGEIGGLVEVNGNLPLDQGRWTNGCAVRVSHMLNKAGHKIPKNGNKTVSGGNKDQYYYRVKDMETYLIDMFGTPDLAITDGSADSWDIPPVPGILVMDFPGTTFSGHTTIWNGAGSVDNADIGGHRVLFWEMPCFVPQDRDTGATIAALATDKDIAP